MIRAPDAAQQPVDVVFGKQTFDDQIAISAAHGRRVLRDAVLQMLRKLLECGEVSTVFDSLQAGFPGNALDGVISGHNGNSSEDKKAVSNKRERPKSMIYPHQRRGLFALVKYPDVAPSRVFFM
jgi:hypothetical protein